MHKFKVPIGDWSDDGHGKCDIYTIECSHDVSKVRQGYKDSCKLTGIQFNDMGASDYNYTDLGISWKDAEYNDRQVAVEYESSEISTLAENALKEHGLNVRELFNYGDNNDNVNISSSSDFLNLLFNFIKLSIPDLTWDVIGDDIQYLNGFWNKELNVAFGYGIYS